MEELTNNVQRHEETLRHLAGAGSSTDRVSMGASSAEGVEAESSGAGPQRLRTSRCEWHSTEEDLPVKLRYSFLPEDDRPDDKDVEAFLIPCTHRICRRKMPSITGC